MVNPLKKTKPNPSPPVPTPLSYELLALKYQPGLQKYKNFGFIFLSQGMINIQK